MTRLFKTRPQASVSASVTAKRRVDVSAPPASLTSQLAHDFSGIPVHESASSTPTPEDAAVEKARVIRLSGGQMVVVHGKFPDQVEEALADGWLSMLDLARLRKGPHEGSGEDAHYIMEVLAQRALPLPGKDRQIKNLSESENLTWSGPTGVGTLGPIGRKGLIVSRYEHYLAWDTAPSFELKPKQPGVPPHMYSMQKYLAEINAETTLAPDDKIALCRLQFLHYVMRYPDAMASRLELPTPTDAQHKKYKKLLSKEVPELLDLNDLATEIGLPTSL